MTGYNLDRAQKWYICTFLITAVLIVTSLYAYPKGMANNDIWLTIKIVLVAVASMGMGVGMAYEDAEKNREKEVTNNV